jgi:hypothetical protein
VVLPDTETSSEAEFDALADPQPPPTTLMHPGPTLTLPGTEITEFRFVKPTSEPSCTEAPLENSAGNGV